MDKLDDVKRQQMTRYLNVEQQICAERGNLN